MVRAIRIGNTLTEEIMNLYRGVWEWHGLHNICLLSNWWMRYSYFYAENHLFLSLADIWCWDYEWNFQNLRQIKQRHLPYCYKKMISRKGEEGRKKLWMMIFTLALQSAKICPDLTFISKQLDSTSWLHK